MTDLAAYLEQNCRFLETAIKDVPAGRDLPPWFAFVKDGIIGMAPPGYFAGSKAMTIELFRCLLKTIDAEQYAIIAAAWYVAIPDAEGAAAFATIDREGTAGAYKDRRRECYQVVAGDREQTLIAMFDVERDYKGKIRRLVRRAGAVPTIIGRMVDLLLNKTRH